MLPPDVAPLRHALNARIPLAHRLHAAIRAQSSPRRVDAALHTGEQGRTGKQSAWAAQTLPQKCGYAARHRAPTVPRRRNAHSTRAPFARGYPRSVWSAARRCCSPACTEGGDAKGSRTTRVPPVGAVRRRASGARRVPSPRVSRASPSHPSIRRGGSAPACLRRNVDACHRGSIHLGWLPSLERRRHLRTRAGQIAFVAIIRAHARADISGVAGESSL
eukprot:6571889-Prymnesium_polylepis.1